eukprot:gene27702-31295_t
MQWQDEEISSEEDNNNSPSNSDDDETSENEESAEDKRRRLAKQYLGQMAEVEDGEESDNDEQGLSTRLKTSRMRAKGEHFEDHSSSLAQIDLPACSRREYSGHKGSVTSIAVTKDESAVYSGSKDNSVIRWDIETGAKVVLREKWNPKENPFGQNSSSGEILAVAVTHDDRFAVSAGRDNVIRVFDSRMKYAEVKALTGHRDTVTSLAFRMDSYTLFSGSLDRCLKHWDLNDMAYIETLFGHQDGVYSVDCWTKEKPLSASSDRTVRLWKVAEETHLVFRGHKSSIDNAQYLTDNSFVSAGQDGSLHLWKDGQKVPVRSVVAAHGYQGSNPNWISSLSTVKMSNVVASGSNDGFVRLWTANAEERQLTALCAVPVEGFANALALTPRLLVVGGGKEHKHGRWWNMKGNHNKLTVVRFDSMLDGGSSEGEEDDSHEGSNSTSSSNMDEQSEDDDEGESEG